MKPKKLIAIGIVGVFIAGLIYLVPIINRQSTSSSPPSHLLDDFPITVDPAGCEPAKRDFAVGRDYSVRGVTAYYGSGYWTRESDTQYTFHLVQYDRFKALNVEYPIAFRFLAEGCATIPENWWPAH